MHSFVAGQIYLALQRLRGEPVKAAIEDVRRTEFISEEELRRIQAERQLAQLRFVLEHVPYYQRVYAPFAARIRTAQTWEETSDLMEELPVLEKDTVRANYREFHARDCALKTHADRTSGSSGTPLLFPVDQNTWAYRHALMFRTMMNFGVEIGEPYAAFFGLHWSKRRRMHVRLRDHIFNRVRISAYEIESKHIEKHYRAICKHRPTHFWGYPSAVHDFCVMLHDRGMDLLDLNLKAIFLTAEPLRDYQREFIQRITGSRCVDTYGSAEGGYQAAECLDGSLHISAETTWLQVRQSESGEPGEAVVTDMMLRSFPLIRYVLGDEIVLKSGKCRCGRPHPMLESVEGRSGRSILLPNGKTISSHLPRVVFWQLAGQGLVRRYRFVHGNGLGLELQLIVGDGFAPEHMKLIEREAHRTLGDDTLLSIRVVETLTPLPNAKHRDYVQL